MCGVDIIEKKKTNKTKQNKRMRMRESVCGKETLNKTKSKDEKKEKGGA